MTRIARGEDGIYIGEGECFVPAGATEVGEASVKRLLRMGADGTLPSVEEATASTVHAEGISFRSPIEEYGKLWGIGLNYAEHADDLDEERPDEPASFMKPSTAAVGPGGPIRLPPREVTDRVTAEGELGVVVGRACSNVAEEKAGEVIAGYVPIIDVTSEDILEKNPRYLTRAKSFDSFLVVGPWIQTPDGIEDEAGIEVKTVVNDEVKARNEVGNMRYSPKELVSFHSRVMTLEPGDIISTGTPGAGVISEGDEVRAEIDQVGTVVSDVVQIREPV